MALEQTVKLFHSFPFVCAEANLWDLHLSISRYLEKQFPSTEYRHLELGVGSFNRDFECKVIKFTYQCDATPGQIYLAIERAQQLELP